jgi:branched-chain amino acid transport system substrate-binding protein
MRCQLAIAVVGATLMAGLGSGIAAPRSDRIEELLQIATGVGRVSSAASVCREISWSRIKVLTDNFPDLIKASVPHGEEFTSIHQAYDQSTIDSQRTVTSKQTDCAAAVRDLVDLERAITSQLATAGTGAPPAARAGTVATPPRAPVTTGTAPDARPRRYR